MVQNQAAFLQAAEQYRSKLAGTTNPTAFRALWRETLIPYAMIEPDPYSPEYKDEVLTVFKGLTKEVYDVELELTSNKQQADEFELGHPWSSKDLDVIGSELAKTVQATRALGTANVTGSVVEFGAGWGNLILTLAKAGLDVTAVDIDPGFMDRIRRLATKQSVAVKTFDGTFLQASTNLASHYEAVVFQSSFHHCIDFDELLTNIISNILSDTGSIFFLSEPIFSEFPFPWGIRYDGEALWAVMFNKWLELGFCQDFFIDLLFSKGLFVSRIPSIEGFIGDGWRARRAVNGIPFSELVLPSSYEEGFFPATNVAEWGRFLSGRARIPARGAKVCMLTFRNFLPRLLKVAIRSGSHIETLHVSPDETRVISVTVKDADIHISSEIFVPDELLHNGDKRQIGIAITHLRWAM